MKRNYLLIALAALAVCLSACRKDDPADPNTSADPEPPGTPTAKIGHFSVSPTRQVAIASGNVQYCPAAGTWRFAPNQYDFVGEPNLTADETYDGWVDLFQWGSGNCPMVRSDNYELFSEFHDWGANFEGGWRSLNDKEMEYLLTTRPRHDTLCVPATVCGITGLVVLPDDWSGPAVNPMYWNSKYTSNIYDAESWDSMEMEGAIFLPAAGEVADGELEDVQTRGYYWVSGEPPTEFNSFMHSYTFNQADVTHQSARFVLRRSVRLVKDIARP